MKSGTWKGDSGLADSALIFCDLRGYGLSRSAVRMITVFSSLMNVPIVNAQLDVPFSGSKLMMDWWRCLWNDRPQEWFAGRHMAAVAAVEHLFVGRRKLSNT